MGQFQPNILLQNDSSTWKNWIEKFSNTFLIFLRKANRAAAIKQWPGTRIPWH